MKQASLKLKMYANNANVIQNDIGNITLRFIFLSFGGLALLYVLLVGNMIFNIVERNSLNAEARVLTSEVRDLELTYLSISNNIDLDLSYSLGFQETKATFATRKSLGSLDSKVSQNEI
ncbi:MAG: hypothetical protein WD963_02040 [Candidatus Paceibacterota bacterium]